MVKTSTNNAYFDVNDGVQHDFDVFNEQRN